MSRYEYLRDKRYDILNVFFSPLREELERASSYTGYESILKRLEDIQKDMSALFAREEYEYERANPGSRQDSMDYMKGDDK